MDYLFVINQNLQVWIGIALLLIVILVFTAKQNKKNIDNNVKKNLDENNNMNLQEIISEPTSVEEPVDESEKSTVDKIDENKVNNQIVTETVFKSEEPQQEKTQINYFNYKIAIDKVVPLKGAIIEIVKNNRYYTFRIVDNKHELLCSSNNFISKVKCLKTVETIHDLVAKGEFVIKETNFTIYNFIINSDLNKEILHSIDYKSKKACENGIIDLVKYIKHIEIKDLS